jgi:hypothetical protein
MAALNSADSVSAALHEIERSAVGELLVSIPPQTLEGATVLLLRLHKCGNALDEMDDDDAREVLYSLICAFGGEPRDREDVAGARERNRLFRDAA